MKLEAGRFYQTVDGRKALILTTSRTDTIYSAVGEVFDASGQRWVKAWSLAGEAEHVQTFCNIVGEWRGTPLDRLNQALTNAKQCETLGDALDALAAIGDLVPEVIAQIKEDQ